MAAGANATAATQPAQVKLERGKEISVRLPVGGQTIRLWLPWDYKPDRAWPVIFWYHGFGHDPTTWPVRQLTNERGFICVGMSYATKKWRMLGNMTNPEPELACLNEARKVVASLVRIDPRMVFLGGFSLGGYTTSVLGEMTLDDWAGLIIIAGGRAYRTHTPPPKDKIRGKPVYIAAGGRDWVNLGQAKRAAQTYKEFGADVTYEEWPLVGHSADTGSRKLLAWLRKHSVLRFVKSDLARARQLRAKGRLGEALLELHRLGTLSQTDKNCLAAAREAKELRADGDKRLRLAEKAIRRKHHADAQAILQALQRDFAGCAIGKQAKGMLPMTANPNGPTTRPARGPSTRPAGGSTRKP